MHSFPTKLMRRVFFRGRGTRKIGLALPEIMAKPLEQLAEEYGYSVPELISLVLDQYLIQEAQSGTIQFPSDFDPAVLDEDTGDEKP
jgi:hypothetical protein